MTDPKLLQQIDERIKETEEDMQELALDDLKISKITKEIKDRLEKFEDLIGLSLNNCELDSLDNFPNQPGLVRLELSNNKFKVAELSKVVDKYPKLQIISLSANNISDFKEIAALSNLKELIQVDLLDNPLSKHATYRKKLFEMIPSLQILDDLDKDGNPYEFDDEEDDEGEDYEGEEDEEDDYDEEDEGDDEEYTGKKKTTNRKKTKK